MNESLSIKDEVVLSMEDFFKSYVVDTMHGSFQVFQSFTYGEMVIIFLLTMIFFLLRLKWFFEVIR